MLTSILMERMAIQMIHPKGGIMPGASASGPGVGCVAFSSWIPSSSEGCGAVGCGAVGCGAVGCGAVGCGDNGCCGGDTGTCGDSTSVSSSCIAVVFVVGVNDAP